MKLMRKILMVCLGVIAFVGLVRAEGPEFIGNCNSVFWTAPSGGPAVEGYRVYINNEPPVEVTADTFSVACAALPTVVGQNSVTVASFNAGGEAAAPAVPFVILMAPPNPPEAVQVQ